MSATTSKPAASPSVAPPWPGTRSDGVAKLEIGGKTGSSLLILDGILGQRK